MESRPFLRPSSALPGYALLRFVTSDSGALMARCCRSAVLPSRWRFAPLPCFCVPLSLFLQDFQLCFVLG